MKSTNVIGKSLSNKVIGDFQWKFEFPLNCGRLSLISSALINPLAVASMV